MSRRKFSPAERHGIYVVHGEKCYLGHEAITVKEMQVDHVIPEKLLAEPRSLAEILTQFGLPADFDLNSFENWLPACGPCNNEKRARPFRPTPLMQHQLDELRKRAPRAKALAQQMMSDRELARAVVKIEAAIERQSNPEQLISELQRLLAAIEPYREAARRTEPIRLGGALTFIGEKGGIRFVSGPYGVGGGPLNPADAARCPVCGASAWNGARCVLCGNLDDGD